MSLRKRIDQDLKAGRLWKARDWEAAEAAFYERYGRKPGMVTAALKMRASIDRFPPEVQQRLRDLQRRLRLEGRYWEPRDQRPGPGRERIRLRDRLVGAGFAFISLLLILAVLVGLYNIGLFLIRAGSS